MRLANGIIIDKEKTFGLLRFSALRREVHKQSLIIMRRNHNSHEKRKLRIINKHCLYDNILMKL